MVSANSRSLEINPDAAYAVEIHIDRAKLTIVLTNFRGSGSLAH
jgi:hypothetical protein